jgi:hypothetical protein
VAQLLRGSVARAVTLLYMFMYMCFGGVVSVGTLSAFFLSLLGTVCCESGLVSSCPCWLLALPRFSG